MGNCQGKKASTDAVNTRSIEVSLDVNKPIPSPVKVENTQANAPITAPTTPEDDKNQSADAAADPAESIVSKKDTEMQELEKIASADEQSAISRSNSEAVISEISQKSSDVQSTVSNVPLYDEPERIKAATSNEDEEPAIVSASNEEDSRTLGTIESLGRTRTDVTGASGVTGPKKLQVEKAVMKKTMMEKVEDAVDSCCGSPITDVSTGESPEESKVITAAEAAQSLDPSSPNYKKKRKLTKKLREIEALEAKDQETLTDEQKEKLTTKETVLESLTAAL